jgi:hypothetical protein
MQPAGDCGYVIIFGGFTFALIKANEFLQREISKRESLRDRTAAHDVIDVQCIS